MWQVLFSLAGLCENTGKAITVTSTLASGFNPIALRKAKIAYNFGLYKCSRVKFRCLCLYMMRRQVRGAILYFVRSYYLIPALHAK